MPRWRWMLMQLTRQLWVRATLIGAMGIIAALLATVADRFIPWRFPVSIGADAVDSILTIIASSMLAVTTFSLNVMTSAYGSATNNVTPRATKLLMEDAVTQNTLSTFIGSFLFAIVGIVVLKTGAYGEHGRSILFVVTIAVIALIVVALLRWIDHLTRLGRVSETTERVETATKCALEERLEEPYLGGVPLRDRSNVPDHAAPLVANVVCYVQHIDMEALSACCEEADADIYLSALPGTFLYSDTPLAWVDWKSGEGSEEFRGGILKAFTLRSERSFDQDPRFGIVVLSEIGTRALSPATNDHGTAIDVIGRLTRLMTIWAKGCEEMRDSEPKYSRVHVPPLKSEELMEDGFMLLARDSAGLVEVQLRLRKALTALSRIGDQDFRAAALHQAQLALDRAEQGLPLDADRARLRE
ncbi:Protein of unknown function DUF2254, membrane [Rhodomicrobium vannielii ATCC 17100]|uniref:DUF2254 domain-containing protein n=1 Tax=Rhodomicrobium vannielii (strain ATCC 17100 / DSM 162 / LMG 4299 / NCIMB 10020 / ATH 3.1.1) TaxID=648757 RepID=E3I1R3_RHOVT|nr:DUF2254 domain-containing protein [Rhodomicrobium vannielii]ADP70132.1 Protein of unknown function DUF2254, membrane [Rhodomicrobium vannielii ATCC 17100]